MMRRTDLDALRIVLCAAVILLHAFMIFSADPYYHIKSAQPSPFASVVAEFLRVTAMVTFFTIAGYAAVTSLRRRSPLQFMKERALRLLVPLVVGIWTSGTIIKYVEMMHGRDLGLHGLRKARTLQAMLDVEPDVPLGFFDFFPRNLGILNLLTWSHLWFLAYLFLISLVLLPLLLWLARRAPDTAKLSAVVLYLPALPLGLYVASFHAYWPYLPNLIADWANFIYFALYMAFGAAIAAWPGIEAQMRAQAPRFAVLMVTAFAGVAYFGVSAAGRVFVGLTAWFAVCTALGFATRYKPAATTALTYLTEATLPVYIIHHAALLLIGLEVMDLPLPVWGKVAAIWLATIAVSLAVYHWLIRPWRPMRWLVGMSNAPAVTPAQDGAAAAPALSR
ncbi:MAG: acyltransferase family protein [Afipia sp.]|nr:acyltransferase family protein [Afipia sp.]